MHIEPLNTTGNWAGLRSSNKADFLFENTLIVVKSTFARACAAVRGFYKNQMLGKNSSGIAENTSGKVLLRGEI